MLHFEKGKNYIHNNIRDFINPIFSYTKLDNLPWMSIINWLNKNKFLVNFHYKSV